MRVSFDNILDAASERLAVAGLSPDIGSVAAQSCAWLEACGYPGLKTLLEAVRDPVPDFKPTVAGDQLDLRNISCVYIAPSVMALASSTQRLTLTRVRHGLYLLPQAVAQELAIGCPVDQSFWLGGGREKNPYGDKVDVARSEGVLVDDFVWKHFAEVV